MLGFARDRALSINWRDACQLRDLRRSTLPFGDGNGILKFASTATKKPRHDARHLK
jgi:hypothetical protein